MMAATLVTALLMDAIQATVSNVIGSASGDESRERTPAEAAATFEVREKTTATRPGAVLDPTARSRNACSLEDRALSIGGKEVREEGEGQQTVAEVTISDVGDYNLRPRRTCRLLLTATFQTPQGA